MKTPKGTAALASSLSWASLKVRLPDDLAAETLPDEEDDIATEQDGHLRNVRRAVAMDPGNKDFLPDF